MSKYKKTNLVLINVSTGYKFDIVIFKGDKGVKTFEFFNGVTSGYPIVFLEQINMDYFKIEEVR